MYGVHTHTHTDLCFILYTQKQYEMDSRFVTGTESICLQSSKLNHETCIAFAAKKAKFYFKKPKVLETQVS